MKMAPVKFLTLKIVFVLAITSMKRLGDLQALPVTSSCLEFASGMVKAFLHPRLGYGPKVPTIVQLPIVLQVSASPFSSSNQEKLHLVCPVREIDTNVHRAALLRKSGK